MECNTALIVIFNDLQQQADYQAVSIYRMRINYRRILQNHIFTNTEQKYMILLQFEGGMFAFS